MKKNAKTIEELFDEVPPEMSVVGDMIEVTWGEETFWPTRSHGWKLGPFVYRSKILPGEDVMDAFKRMWKKLDDVAEKVFESKRKKFAERMVKSQEGHG